MRSRSAVVVLALLTTGLAPVVVPAEEGPTDVAGVSAASVGVHGPLQDVASNLEVVGHTPIPFSETDPRPIGNNGAPALIGDCAYVGRWHDYTGQNEIRIIDVADPAAPTVVGTVPDSVKGGAVAREIRAVDVDGYQLLVVLWFSSTIGESPRAGNNKLLFFTFPDGDCTQPVKAGELHLQSFRPHEFFLWLDPDRSHDVDGHPRTLVFVTAPIGPGNVLVVDASDPTMPIPISGYDAGLPVASAEEEEGTFVGNYAHSISLSPDGTEAYLSYWDAGFYTLDSTAFTLGVPAGAFAPKGAMSVPYDYSPDGLGNTHSAVTIPGANAAVVGDEIYITTDGCPFGWMRIVSLGDATTPPHQIGEFRLAENGPAGCTEESLATGAATDQVLEPRIRYPNVRNANGDLIDGTFTMHNQTVGERFVYTSWYGAGLRVVDVADPTNPTEAGFFVPEPVELTATTPDTPAPPYGQDRDPSNDWWVATWSYPIIRDGMIYVTDIRSGLYILRPTPDAPFADEVANTTFLEGNSNLGALLAG